MINYERIDEYRNTSVLKQYVFRVEDESGRWVADFGNTNIVGESLELKETLCSEEQLTFGSCEASEISFTTTDTESVGIVDKLLYCSTFPGYAVMGTPTVNLGAFRITEDKLSSDRLKRSIKAVDLMYDILKSDVTDWYNGLTFPMTLKAFRDSFFEHIGYAQEETTLVNDSMLVSKTLSTNQLLGSTVIKAICEVNGVFGKMSRRTYTPKVFKYVDLQNYSKSALYPREDLYPSESLYPSGMDISEYQAFDVDQYFTVDYANYVSNEEGLDKLIIRQEENDIGVTVGDGSTFDNVYVVHNNFLLYGLNASELTTVATNLYNKIKYIGYVPLTAVVRGNPCLEVGDAISIKSGDKTLNTFILERSLKGLEALKDTYTARGVDKYRGEANGINAQINQLRGKTTKIKADVEGLSVEVSDLEEDVSAELALKVGRDENDQIVSMINASADVITLNSNRLVVNSDNFKLSREGNVEATGSFRSTTNTSGWYSNLSIHGLNLYKNNDIQGWFGMAGDSDPLMNIYAKNGFYIQGFGDTNEKVLYRIYKNSSDGEIEQYIKGRIALQSPDFAGNWNGRIWTGSWFGQHPAIAIGSSSATNSLVVWGNELVKGELRLGASNEINIRHSTASATGPQLVFESATAGMFLNVNGDIQCNNIRVSGSKYRMVKTDNYGYRGLNAFETAYAQFGDNGSNTIGKNGTCKVTFEKIFAETIDLSKGYQVMITPTSESTTMWVEKKDDCFIVHGSNGATFDWFVSARQKDYADVRLEKVNIPNAESEDIDNGV